MATYVHDTQYFTTRTTVLAAIIALHVFIFWALATGLARKAIEVLAPPIQTDIVQEEKNKVEPPPPPPPEMRKQVVEVPPPDINIAMPEVGPSSNAITATAVTKAAPPAPPRPTGPTTPPRLTKPGDTEGYYPEASRRLGEEGTAAVHVCVASSGKLAGTPTISQSSGKQRLDDAAVSYAKAQRYSAGVQDGKAVDGGCFDYRVKFALH
jgi:periplasmic protein TonB